MPTVQRFAAFKIMIYADDHFPPHFHIVGRGWRCSIELATLAMLAGSAPRRELEVALAWARANRGMLESSWSTLNERD